MSEDYTWLLQHGLPGQKPGILGWYMDKSDLEDEIEGEEGK